jgi:hypothetical protein
MLVQLVLVCGAVSVSHTSLPSRYCALTPSPPLRIVIAPIMNGWFAILNRIVHPNLAVQTAGRVAVDQVIGGPCFPAIFYTSLTLLEGGTLDQVRTKLKAAWFRTWRVGVCVFAPASIINQSVIAPQNRVLFINGVSLCWNVFLSHTNNKYKAADFVSEYDAIKEHES